MASPRLAVPLPLFSADPLLCAEAEAAFPNARFNRGPVLRGAELIAFLQDTDLAICSTERIDAAVLDACPRLRAFGKYGVGLDSFDLAACKAAGAYVGWTAGVNCRTVAETALGLMLAVGRDLFRSALQTREGRWVRQPSRTLLGATVGIVGFGHVGQALVPLLRPFGGRILAHDVLDLGERCRALGVEAVAKDRLLAEADFVTLHVPLLPGTRNLIGAAELARMKPGAILINTARGGLVEDRHLLQALEAGRLQGAGLDVFLSESDPAYAPVTQALVARADVVATPHVGASTQEGLDRTNRIAAETVVAVLDGRTPRPECVIADGRPQPAPAQ